MTFCFILISVLSGCAWNTKDFFSQEIVSKRWLLQEASGEVDTAKLVRLDFSGDHIFIAPGCNRYFGSYSIVNGQLKIGPLEKTTLFCSERAQAIDEAFIRLFTNVTQISLHEGVLVLKDSEAETIFRFKANPKADEKNVVEHIWEIHPKKGICSVGSPKECFYIRSNADSTWRLFPYEIEGFEFKPGTSYKIRVLETYNGEEIKFVLDSIVRQKVKGTRQVLIGP